MQPLTTAERSAILDRHVRKYEALGYRLAARTDVTARMVKPGWSRSQPSVILAGILTVLTFGLWLLVELAIAALGAYRKKRWHLEVDPHGEVHAAVR